MIRTFISIVCILAIVACTTTTSTETVDSLAVELDTMVLDTEPEVSELIPVDTIFTQLEQPVSFNTPQLDSKIAYVYSTNGLDVYETDTRSSGNEAVVLGHIDYKGKIVLLNELVNNAPGDELTIDGLSGHYTAIQFEGKTGYVFSGYLLNFPVPEDTDEITYFNKTLKLMSPAIEKKSKPEEEEGTFLYATYYFEGGIKIYRHEYYEGGGTDVTIPNMSAQEAFLLASHFYESFSKHFKQFPEAAMEKSLPEEITVLVEVQNGRVTKIQYGQGDGCYSEELITVDENGVATLTSDGGC